MKNQAGSLGSKSPPLEARHFVSGLNSRFYHVKLSFADYVAENRAMIRKVRSVLSPSPLDQARLNKIVEGNSPFSLIPSGTNATGKEKKYQRGILLTHGLSDSPYFMRHLGTFFQAQGFRVMAILLPGHGTCPGDLLDMRWQEWSKAVAYGVNRLAEEVDEVYLGGYSAGGVLSIFQSLHDKRVRGIFLFAPALEITPLAAIAYWHKLFSWYFPRLKWVDIKPDRDYFKYESFAKNTATQMYRLTLALNEQMKQHRLEIPVFAVASEDDKTVNVSATMEMMEKQTNPANKLIIYTTDSVKLSQPATQEKIEWVNSMLPEQKILSSAHTALLLASDDEHYGIDGEYSNCIHYYPDEIDKYNVCSLHPEDCWQGEINDKNLKAGMLRRLMYNPNFESLKISMAQFIERLP